VGSITEVLNNYFEGGEASGGMSTLHLLSLPGPINRILRLFIRNKNLSLEALRKAVDEMPADNRLTYAELDEMLDVLCKREWLIKTDEGGVAYYGVNLRPAVASATTKASTASDEEKHSVEELWNKASPDTAVDTGKTAQEIHSAIVNDMDAKSVPPNGTEDTPPSTPDSLNSSSETAAPNTGQESSRTDKEPGKISADDLWDSLG
jgi:hypothetical protein